MHLVFIHYVALPLRIVAIVVSAPSKADDISASLAKHGDGGYVVERRELAVSEEDMEGSEMSEDDDSGSDGDSDDSMASR